MSFWSDVTSEKGAKTFKVIATALSLIFFFVTGFLALFARHQIANDLLLLELNKYGLMLFLIGIGALTVDMVGQMMLSKFKLGALTEIFKQPVPVVPSPAKPTPTPTPAHVNDPIPVLELDEPPTSALRTASQPKVEVERVEGVEPHPEFTEIRSEVIKCLLKDL